ncbi:hypothetical protein IMY05_018G0038200 [Salix suchowensis]|nr:hypothetical protein IMY05_018G0038200 [Salix suchowensis]
MCTGDVLITDVRIHGAERSNILVHGGWSWDSLNREILQTWNPFCIFLTRDVWNLNWVYKLNGYMVCV